MQCADIVIDDEFSNLIPPLTADEDAELEASVIKEQGFTDPVIVWLNYGILVDGHNRYGKWVKVFGRDEEKAPQITEKHFASREEVIEFMLRRQLARRNLSDAMRIKLALRLKPAFEAKAKEKQSNKGGKALRQKSDEALRADEEVAKVAGKSRDTVRKVEKVLSEGTDEVKASMLAGETKINAAYKATVGDPESDRKAAIMGAQKTTEREPGDETESEESTERFKTQRAKTIKTAEALLRAFDDLQELKSRKGIHSNAIETVKKLIATAKEW